MELTSTPPFLIFRDTLYIFSLIHNSRFVTTQLNSLPLN